MYAAPAPKKGGGAARAIASVLVLLLISSVVVNVYLAQFLAMLTSGPYEAEYQPGNEDHRIAILPIKGMINASQADFVRRSLDQLGGEDDQPQALILRVESGGGTVTASDQIWHQITKFKEQTGVPIVASFGSVAASGGYYVAMPSDHIVAERTTTTGSIGVIAPLFTVDKLLDKIGVTPQIIEAPTSPKKDVGQNIARPWTQQDRQYWRDRLAHAHKQFIRVVVDGRAKGSGALGESEVRELAQGQTFTADQAEANHLVDEVGYLDRAIEKASQLANIPGEVTPKVTEMQQPQSFGFSGLIGARSEGLGQLDGNKVRSMLHEVSRPEVMYRIAPRR
jgi:protease-4